MERIVGGKYKLGRNIGSGFFGETHLSKLRFVVRSDSKRRAAVLEAYLEQRELTLPEGYTLRLCFLSLLNQFKSRDSVKFDTFDAALDEFCSKIESRRSEQQLKAKEESAVQKLSKIRSDQHVCDHREEATCVKERRSFCPDLW